MKKFICRNWLQFGQDQASKLESNSFNEIDTTRLTYVYGTSAAEAEDEQIKDEACLQVIHGSVDDSIREPVVIGLS